MDIKTDKEIEYANLAYESYCQIKNCLSMLDELLEMYNYDVVPTPAKALKYATAINRNECTRDEQVSYDILLNYNRISTFIDIAHDYCYRTTEKIEEMMNLK